MKKTTRLVSMMLLAALSLSACNFPLWTPVDSLTPTADIIGTSAALTVQAISGQTAVPTTPVPPGNQPTVAVTTAVPPTSASASPTPTQIAGDWAGFVSDVTIPDGTKLEPNETFTKTWRLKNKGTNTWSTSYAVVFTSGDSMGAPAAVGLPASVAPGATIDISVSLKAPATPKTYTGYFKLRNAQGALFGLGNTANEAFYVTVEVSTGPFAVVSAPTVGTPASSMNCPTTFTFSSKIKVNAAGTVKYHWERSDGTKTEVKSLKFDAAAEKEVSLTWELNSTTTGWARLYIDEPNHQYFPKANFTLTCP